MTNSYTATLTNGTVITRTTVRTYTHYWRVVGRSAAKGMSTAQGGFTSSLDKARKSRASVEAWCRKHGGDDVVIVSDLVEAVCQ